MNRLLGMCSIMVAGCSASSDGSELAVEANALGIAHLEIQHRLQAGDRLLVIRGLGEAGDEIASATLRTGMVLYSMQPELLQESAAAGTELAIRVRSTNIDYVSPDRQPHQLTEPDGALADFVRLSSVSSEIADEAGIRFSPASGETAFAAGACNGTNFPSSKGNPPECCMDGTDLWHTIPSGSNANLLAHRTISTACRTSSGGSGCGESCYVGPCGSAIIAVPAPNTVGAAVFVPNSVPTQCGRDSNGSATGGGVEAPEPFLAGTSQNRWAGVTSTCPYVSCTDGTAVTASALTAGTYQIDGQAQITMDTSNSIGQGHDIDLHMSAYDNTFTMTVLGGGCGDGFSYGTDWGYCIGLTGTLTVQITHVLSGVSRTVSFY